MKNPETIHLVVELIINYLEENNNPEQKVLDYHNINELKHKLNLNLPQQGLPLEKLIPLIELYLQYSIRTGSCQFLNHLWGGFEISGLLAEMITSVSNTSMTLSESAPIALLMEQELIKALNNLIGFINGEGLMVTGGSNANLISMLCARHKFFPEAKYQGLGHSKLVAFTSDQAHFSWLKATNVAGIGMNNLIKVKSDDHGRMIPEELRLAIQKSYHQGKTPFFVAATSGTSVLGAFDPLSAIAEITQKYGLWLHVDGAWGAPVLFSQKHKYLLKGSELADSFTWDAHKLMGVPLICSAILIKNKGILTQTCSSQGTDYVHDQENATEDYNPVQMSLQCSRKVDSLKFWLAWQSHGSLGYEGMVDHLFELADYAVEFISQTENLELIIKPEFLNICFRYNPENTNYSLSTLNNLNLEIRNRLFRSGEVFVNYAHYQDQLMIRLILTNPELQKQDLDYFFHKLINTGRAITEGGTG
jgi:glutamate/tyrosine decarboxylase-like PLP-dependent enzyme